MFYVVLNGQPGSQGKAYHFYKFKSENAAKKCARTDDFSLAFESPDGLEVVCSADDIKGVLTASGVEVPETATKSQMANALFLLVSENATSWSGKNDETTQTEEPDMQLQRRLRSRPPRSPRPKRP
jgi:hypothetical protein